MSASSLKKDKLTSNITVIKKMRDYSKDPTFVKKAEDAKAFIKRHGLPKPTKKSK